MTTIKDQLTGDAQAAEISLLQSELRDARRELDRRHHEIDRACRLAADGRPNTAFEVIFCLRASMKSDGQMEGANDA